MKNGQQSTSNETSNMSCSVYVDPCSDKTIDRQEHNEVHKNILQALLVMKVSNNLSTELISEQTK